MEKQINQHNKSFKEKERSPRRNLRGWSFVLFFLFISVSTQAQLLWEVTGNGTKSPSYLFGTHHLISVDFLEKVPNLYKSFEQSNVVVGEVLLNSVDVMGELQEAMIMPNNRRVSELLSEDDYKVVDEAFQSLLKINLAQLDVVRPIFLSTMYQTALFSQKTGFTGDQQSDSYFQHLAIDKGKKVLGLETTSEQVKILLGTGSLQEQADDLVELVQRQDSVLNALIEITEFYREGSLDKLYKLSKDESSGMTEKEADDLINNRNLTWANKLDEMFISIPSSYFVAVGALHLPGERGLIQLLRGKGYKVKPMY